MEQKVVFDENIACKDLIKEFFKLFPKFSLEEKTLIEKAWSFLYEKSQSLREDWQKPFCFHCVRVASILAESGLDAECVIAGLFHNVFEVNIVKPDELKEKVGEVVFNIISGTAKITGLKIQSKSLQQADSIRKMLFAMVDDMRVIFVKLADRLDRLRNISVCTEEEQKQIAQEVFDIWAPLANRLGMSSVKSEMEDLSLKISNNDVYLQIKKIVALKKSERGKYLEKAEKDVLRSAARAGIEVSVSSRAKHFYSIYQKMRKRNKSPEELFDLLAMRILCNTTAECYTMIGIVHGLWKPLEGRFKDYIAMPKSNGYQSLHTTVLCEGQPLEIQIRTKEMHGIAEYGVASHWLYKKGTNRDTVNVENLSIINQLKQLKNNASDDESAFAELKEELLGDSIFVFTPKGDVVELPIGSTAIDFAYKIHSAIGEKITGAKADGHIIPLSTALKNTQIIEVLTSSSAHPTENQLQIAKTTKARSKIRSWLAQNGFEKFGVEKSEIKTLEEEGCVHQRGHKKGVLVDAEKVFATTTFGKIRIGDTKNYLVSQAGCCLPLIGDKIVGYVSNGRGIIIHRADCPEFKRIPDVEERTLAVEWDVE
ncbi:MAG: bifunctional (p)ppGpp synthetase/guanosine-3',5'-bis(diphosphate) 3'-pyrophosphohydrolase [Spirochaetaceae bacterium]|nr:bifunctional (p)ppGpp synthetase/guanosine-3',5'-bis(diphosphate) 3'-pyrophosphohydrolase [Spirochaetaceae bacterium]